MWLVEGSKGYRAWSHVLPMTRLGAHSNSHHPTEWGPMAIFPVVALCRRTETEWDVNLNYRFEKLLQCLQNNTFEDHIYFTMVK